MAIELAEAYISILPSTSKLAPAIREELGKAEKGAQAQGKRTGHRFSLGFKAAMGAAAVGVGAVAVGIKQSLGAASDLGESLNAVTVTYGKQAAGVKKLSDESARGLGLSSNEFNSLAVRFSAFAKQVGGGGSGTVKALDALTGRAADFASVMNIEVSEAAELFQSGLAGETEPLRKYGIDLSAAAVKAYAYANGIAEQGAELTEQQKVQARYASVMDQTAKTQGDFANTSDSAANQGRVLAAVAENLKAKLGKGLLPVLETAGGFLLDRVIPGFEGLFDLLVRGDFTGEFGKALGISEGHPLIDFLFTAREAAIEFGLAARDAWDKQIRPALAGMLGVGQTLFSLVAGNMKLLLGLAGVVGAVALAFKAWNVIRTVVGGLKLFLGLVKTVWAVMAFNPITFVIVALVALAAGLVLAYKKSETFRRIVDGAWTAIKNAVKAAWEGVIKPALLAMWGFIRDDLIPAVQRLWSDVIRPVFAAIGDVVKSVWTNVVAPIFRVWVSYLRNVLAPVIGWLWKKIIAPAFGAIGGVVKTVWEKVVKPALGALMDFLSDKVVPAFSKAADFISRFFEGLRGAANVAIRFVVNTLWNDGLRKVLNWIPGVNVGRVSLPVSSTRGFASPSAPSGYAGGGYTGRGGKYDPAGIVHRDEFVIRSDARKRFEQRAPGALDYLNTYGTLPGFARGGRVWPTADRTPTTYPGHDGLDFGMPTGSPIWAAAPGRVSYVGWNRGYGQAVFTQGSYGELVYGHMSRTLARIGQYVRAGQRIGDVGSTGNSTGPHLHFGFPGGTYAQALAFLRGANVVVPGGARSGGLFTWVADLMKNLRSMGNNGWAGMLKDAFRSVIADVRDRFSIFDNGGVLEPGHFAYNASRHPEAVFNHRQFRDLATAGGPARGCRYEMRITNWRDGTGYMREVADGAAADRAGFAATTGRMR